MTEVIGIKFEETGAVEYVVPDKNYAKDDFVVVLEKKDKRLAQVAMENTDFPEVSLPADLNRVEGLAGEKDFARYDENLLKAEKRIYFARGVYSACGARWQYHPYRGTGAGAVLPVSFKACALERLAWNPYDPCEHFDGAVSAPESD